jgi:hypothetical protein
MTGHHPWKTLLDGLTPERRKAIAAGAAKIRADIEHREQQLSRASRASSTPAKASPASADATAR